ncbi:MAG: hypothetical protein Q9183_005872 [Haloplaca sp. 2 TL-2023]
MAQHDGVLRSNSTTPASVRYLSLALKDLHPIAKPALHFLGAHQRKEGALEPTNIMGGHSAFFYALSPANDPCHPPFSLSS